MYSANNLDGIWGGFVQAFAAQEADGDYTDFCKAVLNVTLTGNQKTQFDFTSIFKQNTFWRKKSVYLGKFTKKHLQATDMLTLVCSHYYNKELRKMKNYFMYSLPEHLLLLVYFTN